jgi:hypothetical protein
MSTQNFKRSNNKEMRYNIKIEKNNNKKIYKKNGSSKSPFWTYLVSLERFRRDDSNHILKYHKTRW